MVCVTDIDEVYFTDWINKSISRLSLSGLVSKAFRTDSFKPVGICQTKDGDLLITLRDTRSDLCKLKNNSRLLIRRVTLTGDVIHVYEYYED